ncbi:WecB/TagA/CpsF family glycosyltransferase [Rossellomorea oryzaecorticis]|uniref:WecB/TagA/CpsF family glycosyltransferase n=1 Tax=Rossellomorea oryzaecorticis TaxID=1396505 RepID=A0ABU9K5I1_9BACI
MKKVFLRDVKYNVGTKKEALQEILNRLTKLEKTSYYICVNNVHTSVECIENTDFKKINNSSYLSITDGMPLVYYFRYFKGINNIERITGPDLMLDIFKDSRFNQFNHFFYGSTNQTLNKLISNLKTDYKEINISGYYSPPFRTLNINEKADIIKKINDSNADFVWVGLGAPKQEEWMSEFSDDLEGKILVGVGAAFDYHAGNIKRAPIWMQKFSLEWLYRLFQEPKRLFKRYLKTNTKFLFYIIINGFSIKRGEKK